MPFFVPCHAVVHAMQHCVFFNRVFHTSVLAACSELWYNKTEYEVMGTEYEKS